jgi:hypothetical protein
MVLNKEEHAVSLPNETEQERLAMFKSKRRDGAKIRKRVEEVLRDEGCVGCFPAFWQEAVHPSFCDALDACLTCLCQSQHKGGGESMNTCRFTRPKRCSKEIQAGRSELDPFS